MVHNLVPFIPNKYWLIRHSMASKAIYSSHDSDIIQDGRQSVDCDVMIKPAAALHRFIPSKPLLL